ncbi:hypothetical protein EMIHUDRAFT_425634 [Emiliania huxleyi CCMP1516]|uniref:Threonylcarbamoyl-AMP synthase n=2 Tax=Emiliania huxleyi TaxID=2903 RepID=A0A0D3KFZ6_EMIH1|nr:hypothetical protein EMIHUDRAFT_425634 [Emiliania huxleyi CCMP1516]EOD34681.1 hypothetical protein EMIHUDRAFT_425634 [Emiliania huxleyi CCMP1516]|eukprot:XP_005787110.1 hypothetical protein EMIHUDRAFT_425634 [Emiliania huxleyi CCMP1516]
MAASSTAPRPGRLIDSLDEAASALRSGRLVAFPTETVYGLGADAFNEASVASIFTVKGRPRSDPLIVHVASAGAAEALVRLGPGGLELMRRLTASFWPGPLTLVAPAVPELPSAVTSGSGYVGVRVPEHALARELLQRAAVPVAAPSANRFGHVSPTRAQHVMDDLAHHPILVLDAPPADCCGVGIESTVVKIDEQAGELVLLRRGGVPEASLERWLAAEQGGAAQRFTLKRMVSPGMLLTHYSPDLPAYLLRGPQLLAAPPPGAGSAPLSLGEAVLLDFGGRLAHLRPAAAAYRDLSERADAAAAASGVFEALRWAEAQHAAGARCVLVADVEAAARGGEAAECVPALADRLYRAASGVRAELVASPGTGGAVAVWLLPPEASV